MWFYWRNNKFTHAEIGTNLTLFNRTIRKSGRKDFCVQNCVCVFVKLSPRNYFLYQRRNALLIRIEVILEFGTENQMDFGLVKIERNEGKEDNIKCGGE